MDMVTIETIQAIADMGFPLAFLFVSYLALRAVVPILQSSEERVVALTKQIADTQEQIAETLRGQAIVLNVLEQRLSRIERSVGNTRSSDK